MRDEQPARPTSGEPDLPESPRDEPRGEDVMALGRRRETAALSPRMTAVFGGLFGLAIIASVFALLIQVFPVRRERAAAIAAPDTTASAEGTATPSASSRKRVRVPIPGPWRLSALASDDSIRIVKGTMNRRSFIIALGEAGVPKAQVYRILKSMDGVRKFDRCGKRDKFAVALKRAANKVVAFEYEVSPTEIYQSREDDAGLLQATKLDMKVRLEEFATAFYVGKDVERSAKFAGLEDGILAAINKSLSGRTSTEAFEEGSIVKAVLIEQTALGRFVRYQRIQALEYRPANPEQKTLRSYWFEGESVKGYVDEKGRTLTNKGWRSPIPGAAVTSHFNPKRMHPILKRIVPHQGTDYGAAGGTPIYAAFRGTVSRVGWAGGYGKVVVIDHPGGIETWYAHCSRFAKGLKAGQKVGTRQLIAYVGSTGRSTGPHLHFGAKKNGKWFNALELRMDAWHPLPASERADFLAIQQRLNKRLEAIPLPDPPPEETAPPAETAEPEETAAPEDSAAPESEPADDSSDDDFGEDLMGEDLSLEPE